MITKQGIVIGPFFFNFTINMIIKLGTFKCVFALETDHPKFHLKT
jgi:hypothetical protein